MAIGDWDKAPDGTINAAPVVAWDAVAAGKCGMLRVQFVRSEDQLQQSEFEAIQIGMTSRQARTLAGDLLQIADRLDRTEWGGPQ